MYVTLWHVSRKSMLASWARVEGESGERSSCVLWKTPDEQRWVSPFNG
eukprot:CAMPEP_0197407918 /NCGR_PEP_ID=MMETSP1165-20131217/27684_1 /TAXON_ID=284809 /ORGANISM="Chrysocystis fragilis, Strain CCMP3189" /LENGTH=47 /DNA_ID= /DNA_START= /DNA_END= /DNA_ORIENTATION=